LRAARFPKIGTLMDAAKVEVLAFTAFPRQHWSKTWSTNPLERVNKEPGLPRRSADRRSQAGRFPRADTWPDGETDPHGKDRRDLLPHARYSSEFNPGLAGDGRCVMPRLRRRLVALGIALPPLFLSAYLGWSIADEPLVYLNTGRRARASPCGWPRKR
jgi:hypothetical protein